MLFKHSTRLLFPLLILAPLCASAQQNPTPPGETRDAEASRIEQRLDQVLAALGGMQHELEASKQQIDQLQNQMRDLRSQMQAANPDSNATAAAAQLQQSVQQLQSDDEILQSEVKQHDQTKVETTSKFPLRVSGLVLFSSFLNNGAVDNIDLPILALPRAANSSAGGSFAATLRQSVIGLNARGPEVGGAQSSADMHVDFFGGVPYTGYTTATGTLRLRTAHVRLDWPDHSLVGAFDSPLITPLQPTSYIAIGEPALSWSGNLWVWAPQLQSLNRTALGPGSLHYDFSLIDPPAPGSPAISGERQPNPAESSRQPGYESRISYSVPFRDRPFTLGAAGYYSRQTYPGTQHIDAWSGTADWRLPFTRWLEISGALYRGRALGGLGGGVYKDYIMDPDSGSIRGLNAEGGWSQMKIRFSRSLEGNAMIGEDAGFSSEIRYDELGSTDPYSSLARNRTIITNLTYRPKAYFYVSAEYRNIDSWPVTGHVNIAQAVGLATGYSF
ncbi:MAG: hypothetical protein WA510_10580 [Acidobacteriaceae bacterium]